MEASAFECKKCASKLPVDSINTVTLTPCPTCGTEARVYVFPALFKPPEKPHTPDRIIVNEESSCFYHPEKRAVIPCDHCGRFLCALCDVAFGDRHLCPACIETGATPLTETAITNEYSYYDNVALMLAFLPVVTVIFWILTLLTAPLALFVVVRYWKRPLSIMPRRRWRYVAAALFASAQIIAWGYFIIAMITGIASAAPLGP